MTKKPVHNNLFLYPPRYCPCCYRDTARGRVGDCAECGVVSHHPREVDLPPLRAPTAAARRARGNLVVMAIAASVSGTIWYFLALWGLRAAGVSSGMAPVAFACLAAGVAVVAVGLVAINGGDADDTDPL